MSADRKLTASEIIIRAKASDAARHQDFDTSPKFRYGKSVTTNNAASLDGLVEEVNAYIKKMDGKVSDSFFQAIAIRLSRNNLVNPENDIKGGPFGAIIVRYSGGVKDGKGIGMPEVVGVGANHVFPESDPTAHAEMVAYRDAAKRLKSTDFSGCAMFTSACCCPMCLSVGNGSGLQRISYDNTAEQAKVIAGFADDLQYSHFRPTAEETVQEHMTQLSDVKDSARRALLEERLGNNDAVVINAQNEVIGVGKADTLNDPTMVPSLAAIRDAAKTTGFFCLPEDCTLITREIPHPAGFIAADWARILRDRDRQALNDPERDNPVIDPKRIVYVTPEYEQMVLRDADGRTRIAQDSKITYAQPALPDEQRAVPTDRHESTLDPEKHPNNAVLTSARQVFETWHEKTGMGAATKY